MPQTQKVNVKDILAADPPRIVYKDGLRAVLPYYYVYQTYAKDTASSGDDRAALNTATSNDGSVGDSWKCTTEFRDRSKSYYEWAIQTGIATINSQPATLESVVHNGDLIQLSVEYSFTQTHTLTLLHRNKVHAHEPPVVAELPVIIYENKEKGWLVVSKPGSMPVHAAGRYRKNTLLEILHDEYQLKTLYCCNRLDRLTSGVMVIGTTKSAGQELGAGFMRGVIKKEYIARVFGYFPDKEVVDEPIITVDRQMGLVIRHEDGKPATTIFERMSYDAETDTSVVYCQPLTGRTHQIRVHLQYLGHPIANDPLYASHEVWGIKRGKGGWPTYTTDKVLGELLELDKEHERGEHEKRLAEEVEQQRLTELREHKHIKDVEVLEKHLGEHAMQFIRSDEDIGFNSPVALSEEYKEVIRRLRAQKDESDGWARWRDALGFGGEEGDSKTQMQQQQQQQQHRDDADNLDSVTQGLGGYCPTCFIPLIADPPREKLFIYLHATRYTSPEWCFEAPLPNWIDDAGKSWWEVNNESRKKDIQEEVQRMVPLIEIREKEEEIAKREAKKIAKRELKKETKEREKKEKREKEALEQREREQGEQGDSVDVEQV
ncbi:hypothetical protein E3P99_01403 [Wallemia hederae]|uniref:Pseudouridine synthase RsuA/RluA-like domain-containing protein n=1 Tax=Wallemia hederae TaxID=1540922 RepID=A0A4T0FR96_9BASI|nr:hypothetical protein E3P99_01403 [Wallemia hederae]